MDDVTDDSDLMATVRPGRRDVLLLASGLLLSGNTLAVAQQPGAGSAPVLRPRAPCRRSPEDIVGLVIEGSGAPAGTVAVFGHAFRQGDLPRGIALTATQSDGKTLPVQADITTRHADGSVRMAIVSLAVPALRDGEQLPVMLARGSAASQAPAFDVVAASAGRVASVEIVPLGGGSAWRVDLLTRMLDTVIQPASRAIWQSGPLAAQARVELAVPPEAVGGARSARLVADIALRADGTLWSDVWVRNDIAMRPGGGTAQYTLRLAQDGQDFVLAEQVSQFQYTGFGRLTGTRRQGAMHRVPDVKHDIGYLADAGAIARYDQSVGIDPRLLARMTRTMAEPAWNQPFGNRGIAQNMGASGGRADIGVTTAWQAAWLISGDRRTGALVIDQAEATGSIPWHFWDPGGGSDGQGGWMDTARWPRFWTDPRGGRPPFTLLQPIAPNTGWQVIQSHQPDLSFVPYLLTGRRSLLDGVQSQGVMGILTQWPAVRADPDAPAGARDTNVVHRNQVRGAAWSLRQLDNAAWISPDTDANTAFLRAAAAANWNWVRRQTAAWTAQQGEAHGWIPGAYEPLTVLPPWQQDFFASSAAAAARHGNEDARFVLRWMSNFLVGRFLAEDRGFNTRDGAAYLLVIAPRGSTVPDALFRTWAEIAEATRAADLSNATGWRHSNGYYGQTALQSLSAIIDVLDDPRARRARDWLVAAAPPFTSADAFAQDPTFNIIPRGGERVASRVRRCEAVPGQQRQAP